MLNLNFITSKRFNENSFLLILQTKVQNQKYIDLPNINLSFVLNKKSSIQKDAFFNFVLFLLQIIDSPFLPKFATCLNSKSDFNFINKVAINKVGIDALVLYNQMQIKETDLLEFEYPVKEVFYPYNVNTLCYSIICIKLEMGLVQVNNSTSYSRQYKTVKEFYCEIQNDIHEKNDTILQFNITKDNFKTMEDSRLDNVKHFFLVDEMPVINLNFILHFDGVVKDVLANFTVKELFFEDSLL